MTIIAVIMIILFVSCFAYALASAMSEGRIVIAFLLCMALLFVVFVSISLDKSSVSSYSVGQKYEVVSVLDVDTDALDGYIVIIHEDGEIVTSLDKVKIVESDVAHAEVSYEIVTTTKSFGFFKSTEEDFDIVSVKLFLPAES